MKVNREIVYINVLLLVMTGFVLFPMLMGKTTANQSILTVEEVREVANSAGSYFLEKKIPSIVARNATSNDSLLVNYEDLTVVAMLSNMGCNPCQNRELRLLQSLKNEYGEQLHVVGIYQNLLNPNSESNRQEVLRLKKITKASFLMTYSSDTLMHEFIKEGRYPYIAVVENGTQLLNYFPIPEDEEYSLMQQNRIDRFVRSRLSVVDR